MDALRNTFRTFFRRNLDDVEEHEQLNADEMLDLMQQQQQSTTDQSDEGFNITTSDPPIEGGALTLPGTARNIGETGPSINYQVEFLNFIERNTPSGFANKFQHLVPYLALGFVTWPSYWLWRGYQWESRRRTERIGLYIQRTFQHAKLMQVAILTVGFLMASAQGATASSLPIHEVAYNRDSTPDDDEDD
ncbi:uncharacterized protein LOC127565565 [Drosophila albomicans]|uniref:Uncharacterized protein LOC127565565 n=1 Tax=Drosophila albomicans TaxID=7291 RepID=A0A9C6WAG1_DROAB|nr:uncharacterized protein LOC127565565 [Drosophila albomicans]